VGWMVPCLSWRRSATRAIRRLRPQQRRWLPTLPG